MSIRPIAALASTLALLACTPPLPAPNPSSSPTAPPPHQAPVVLTYLGVAGWQVSAGAHSILVDPYFSRVDVEDTSAPLFPDQAAITRYAPEHADAILVEHSHYDHLL